MVLWGNFKRYAIYRKLLISYLILVLISILLISTLLYQRFSYQAASEINRLSMSSLNQLVHSAEVLHNQVISIGHELLNDPDIITSMLGETPNRLLDNEVAIKLNSIQGVYPFIKYISVFNGNTGRYLNNKGITKAIDRDVISMIKDDQTNQYLKFAPRMLRLDELNLYGKPEPVLTYILYSNFSNLIPRNGAVIINIEETELIGKASQDMMDSADEEWMVVNDEGIVLSHRDPEQFMTSINNEDYYQKIMNTDQSKGFFTQTYNESKQLIVYAKSKDTGWITIGSRPYNSLFFNITGTQTIVWSLAILLTLIGILVAVSLAGRMYKPYTIFENQRKKMETSLKHAVPVMQETYFRRLLTGAPEIPAKYAELFKLDSHYLEGNFCAIVIKIDDSKKFNMRPFKEQEVIRFAINNILEELLMKHDNYYSLELDNDHLVVIAHLADPKLPESFLLTLLELQQTVRQYFKILISAGIGDIANSVEEIRDSYRSAKEYLKYRFFLEHGSIIDHASISEQIKRSGEYPSKIESLLLESINLGRKKEAEQEIQRFITAIRKVNYKHAFVYANQLVISIQKKFDHVLSSEEDDYENHSTLLYSLSDLETLDEITTALKEFSITIIDRIEEKKGSRNSELVESVQQLIRSRYNDPLLSLEWAADQVHYSSGYLSKLFKQITQQSFNDYITTIRLEEAVRLLKTTNDSATLISEKVGIGSSTYFFTLFKKTYGMTPAQFRTQNSITDL